MLLTEYILNINSNMDADMNAESLCVRRITIPIQVEKKPKKEQSESTQTPHIPKMKVITERAEWELITQEYGTPDSQLELLDSLRNHTSSTPPYSSAQKILVEHLKTKLSGYRSQDVAKGLYDKTKFISVEQVIELLVDCKLLCFYCKSPAKIFYDFVRDSKQWSLERVDNSVGHNYDNIVISCLVCNLRRRTMHQNRYIATKQMRVNKLERDDDDEN